MSQHAVHIGAAGLRKAPRSSSAAHEHPHHPPNLTHHRVPWLPHLNPQAVSHSPDHAGRYATDPLPCLSHAHQTPLPATTPPAHLNERSSATPRPLHPHRPPANPLTPYTHSPSPSRALSALPTVATAVPVRAAPGLVHAAAVRVLPRKQQADHLPLPLLLPRPHVSLPRPLPPCRRRRPRQARQSLGGGVLLLPLGHQHLAAVFHAASNHAAGANLRRTRGKGRWITVHVDFQGFVACGSAQGCMAGGAYGHTRCSNAFPALHFCFPNTPASLLPLHLAVPEG